MRIRNPDKYCMAIPVPVALLYVVHVAVHLSHDAVPGLEHCLSLTQPITGAVYNKHYGQVSHKTIFFNISKI
jgi:hypothetical protein